MHIFITDLDEDGAGVGEQVAGNGETVAEVGEVGMDAVTPGVAEGFDLLRFAGDVVGLAVGYVAAGGGPLEVGVELDAVGRIEVDALDLAAQALALGERGHDVEAVAEDKAVGPVGVVLVEFSGAGVVGQAVEVGEEVNLRGAGGGAGLGLAEEVVNEDLGMDLFLDVKRRRGHDEVGPVGNVLATPDELRVEVAVAAFVGDLDGGFVLRPHEGLVFGGGEVLAPGVVVAQGGDGLGFAGGFGFGRHGELECGVLS
jgi:hypothetical protein